MQNLSDKMGENQFAIVHGTCMDCHKECSINLERTGPETIEIKNGAIGNRNDEYYFKCDSCWEKDKNFGQQSEVYEIVRLFSCCLRHCIHCSFMELLYLCIIPLGYRT